MTYEATSLYDGTVIAAAPIRKPAPRIMKRDGLRVDADGVIVESMRAGKELSDWTYENRFRFQDLITASLNTKRALRQLVLPVLEELRSEIAALRAEVAELKV
jgi:hypothetical protein